MKKFEGKYEKLSEILNEINEFGISDDSERDNIIDSSSYDTLVHLTEINYSNYGDLLSEYIEEEMEEEKKMEDKYDDEFLIRCLSFSNTITLARIVVGNSSDPRNSRYQDYLEYTKLKGEKED